MSVLLIVLPIALVLAAAGVAAFIWMARTGQLDDLETPAVRMLFDDESSSPRGEVEGDETEA